MQGAPLVENFATFGHSAESLKWWVIEKVHTNPMGGNFSHTLNFRECKWIQTFDTTLRGLNEYEEIERQDATLNSG